MHKPKPKSHGEWSQWTMGKGMMNALCHSFMQNTQCGDTQRPQSRPQVSATERERRMNQRYVFSKETKENCLYNQKE